MRTFTPLVSLLIAAAVLGGCQRVAPHTPPAAAVAKWAEGCRADQLSCWGDIYVLQNGNVDRFDPTSDGVTIIEGNNPTLSHIVRIVPALGDVNAYGHATQEYYMQRRRRTG